MYLFIIRTPKDKIIINVAAAMEPYVCQNASLYYIHYRQWNIFTSGFN